MAEARGYYAKVTRRGRIWWHIEVRFEATAEDFIGGNYVVSYDVPSARWARSKARRAVARYTRKRELRAKYANEAYYLPERTS